MQEVEIPRSSRRPGELHERLTKYIIIDVAVSELEAFQKRSPAFTNLKYTFAIKMRVAAL
jgi:hypothetical protein